MKENFTFKKRNIKSKLMKKISTFLDFVETEEKQFKKEKNITAAEINKL